MIRHGLTDWNVEERLQGQADTDINAVGREQAERNGRRLAELIGDAHGFDFVASPLRRTRETMERIRVCLGMPEKAYRTDPRLLEVHFGDWQGSTYAELELRYPGSTLAREKDKWEYLPPGEQAESYVLLARRVESWLADVDEPTVCVTHGGVIRCMFHLLAGMPGPQAAALNIRQDRILRIEGGRLEWL
jgi:probable phosphoglycerate mutase